MTARRSGQSASRRSVPGCAVMAAVVLSFAAVRGAQAADAAADIADLRRQAAELGRKLERLEDGQAIERLQRAYGYYVDKAQWPEVADLFADNGTLEIGGRGIFVGRARVLEYLVTGLGPVGMSTRRGQILNHQQLQPVVTVAPDGRTAEGRWSAFVMAAGPGEGWGHVTYENDYVKQNGVWKIARLHAPFNVYTSYKGGWKTAATPNTRPDSFLPPPDLPPSVVYLTYPSFYVEPFHYPNPVTGRPMPAPHPAAGGMAKMR